MEQTFSLCISLNQKGKVLRGRFFQRTADLLFCVKSMYFCKLHSTTKDPLELYG